MRSMTKLAMPAQSCCNHSALTYNLPSPISRAVAPIECLNRAANATIASNECRSALEICNTPCGAIQSNHLWKASRGIEAAEGLEDKRLPITAPSARSSELGGDFGARRSVTRACISSRRAISRAAILCACTCRGSEGGNQHAIRRAAILCAITVRGSTIAISN
jgi:hypothetical protein